MNALALSSENFDSTIAGGRVLVDFWADWCMPCKMLLPTIDELAIECGGNVTVAKVNIDDESALAARYDVMSIPTVIIFDNGVEIKRFVGVQPKEAYKSALK